MTINVERITATQAAKIMATEEGQFSDVKAIDIAPAKLSRTVSAFANSDGGDLYIGIDEIGTNKDRYWRGFPDQEAANGHIQLFEELFPLGTGFDYTFLRTDIYPGLVLHVQVGKTLQVIPASDSTPYIRRGAQSLPVTEKAAMRRLEFTKGISSFETELLNVPIDMITDSEVIQEFISMVVPTTTPSAWLRKQSLLREDKPTAAGVLLFSDEPQAQLPKRCGVKIYRYKTTEGEGFRNVLDFDPETVEGCLYNQIKRAVSRTIYHVEGIKILTPKGLESIKYPVETLHEIITNAVLHRDYSIADDVHIRIFDNRIEVQSPGKLPAHITVNNILTERYARNGAIVRILNKFPDPPNKDVGEGLNTAFRSMHQLGLKEPVIEEQASAVLVTIRHETLASPQTTILEYLETHPTIKNRQAREITHITEDYQIKNIFRDMVDAGLIEQVPGTKTSSTAYQKVNRAALPDNGNEVH